MVMRCAAAVLLVLLGACSGDNEPSDHPLGELLLVELPGTFERVGGPSGPMDAEVAPTSLGYVSTPDVRRQLTRTGFQEGYARVWQDGSDFVTILVFDFISDRRADEMVTFVSGELDGLRGSQGFTVEDIPEAKGFTLNAAPRSGEGSLFCQLVWFSSGTRAYEVRMCGQQPSSSSEVQELARRQDGHARETDP